ncbi:MAG: hypothetical protein ACRD59_06790 [Candidatus Acidiferrales bacterium]
MTKTKMVTIEQRAVGTFDWEGTPEQARIERNLFALNGRSREALRFCKNKHGRHNRVHLVIEEENFVELFRSAVENGVFSDSALRDFRNILGARRDPFLDVIGTTGDGKLSAEIDKELYGEDQA